MHGFLGLSYDPSLVPMLHCRDIAPKWTQDLYLHSGEGAELKHTILIQTSQGKNRLLWELLVGD